MGGIAAAMSWGAEQNRPKTLLCFKLWVVGNGFGEGTKKINEFHGIGFCDEQQEFYHSRAALEAAQSSKLWENVEKPVTNSRVGQFRKGLSHDQIHIVESAVADVMDSLGYAPEIITTQNPLNFTSELLAQYNDINRELKKAALLQCNAEDLDRRNYQQALLDEISARS